jgi:holliday junction DNA helicase RuvA
MISYLKGQVKQKFDKSVLLVTNNIGYQIAVPEFLLVQVKVGDELELYTHLHVSSRDETMDIYGFATAEELAFFEQLISISGVGRKSALAALSVAKIDELQKTISRGDSALLQKVAGIGKKTAERIVVELKDKVLAGDISTAMKGSDGEVISALEGLGYKIYDIREVLRQLPKELESSEDKIKSALKMLGKS